MFWCDNQTKLIVGSLRCGTCRRMLVNRSCTGNVSLRKGMWSLCSHLGCISWRRSCLHILMCIARRITMIWPNMLPLLLNFIVHCICFLGFFFVILLLFRSGILLFSSYSFVVSFNLNYNNIFILLFYSVVCTWNTFFNNWCRMFAHGSISIAQCS